MHNKTYANKVAKSVPTDSLPTALALYDVLKRFTENDKAQDMAAKLSRTYYDEFLFLNTFNIQIVKRIKWIKRNEKYEFVPNFKEIIDYANNDHLLRVEMVNNGTILDCLNQLKLKVGMSTEMTPQKKQAVINKINLLLNRLKHLPSDNRIYDVSMSYNDMLNAFIPTIQNSSIRNAWKRSIIAAINLVKGSLKYIK
jgi:hypothetical protein